MNGDDGITTTELPAQRAAADQISKRTRSARHSEERTQQPQQPQEERQPPRQPTFNVVAAQSTAHKHSCYNKATSDMADQLDDINHLFHINFMESMQLLNAREKRSVHPRGSAIIWPLSLCHPLHPRPRPLPVHKLHRESQSIRYQ